LARRRKLRSIFAAIGKLGCVAAVPGLLRAQNVTIDADDIGGWDPGGARARPTLIRRLREGSGAAMVALGIGLALAGRPST
jgi:hypothetical protein